MKNLRGAKIVKQDSLMTEDSHLYIKAKDSEYCELTVIGENGKKRKVGAYNFKDDINNLENSLENKLDKPTSDGTYLVKKIGSTVSYEIFSSVDLSNYYTKTETYSQTQIDNIVSNLELEIDNKANLSDVYLKTETYNQTEINNFLSGKQNIIGYTPENVVNKSDSYTVSSSTTYASTKALIDGLGTKLDKGGYSGTAQDLKNSIDAKLNKPTTTSNTTSYPFVVGEDGNGNSARLPAGDLGKNFFNSDLSNTTARNHTMNAGVTVNTLGNPFSLTGLPNKNADIANFRKVRVQNTSGLDSVVDSKNLLTDGITSMTDAEKDSWRLAQRKSNENYSTGQPRVDLISPININNSYSYTQYVSVIGLNLYINTGASVVKLVRVKDENGVSITPEETLIDASSVQTFSTNFQILVLGINFFGKAKGYYKIYITSFTGLTNLTSPEFFVKENFNLSNFNPVSFSVVDKYANSSDYVTSSEIYHINQQQVGKTALEKSVKSNVLFNFQNGFLYEFNFEMYLVGSYTNASFNCGFSNGDFDITNGYSPQAFLGVGGDNGHRFINSVTNKDHNQARNQTVVVKCIFFNKDGITTIIQLAPNGVVLISSMSQDYNVGDPIRFYANFYSSNGGFGTDLGQNFKIKLPSTYQSF